MKLNPNVPYTLAVANHNKTKDKDIYSSTQKRRTHMNKLNQRRLTLYKLPPTAGRNQRRWDRRIAHVH